MGAVLKMQLNIDFPTLMHRTVKGAIAPLETNTTQFQSFASNTVCNSISQNTI